MHSQIRYKSIFPFLQPIVTSKIPPKFPIGQYPSKIINNQSQRNKNELEKEQLAGTIKTTIPQTSLAFGGPPFLLANRLVGNRSPIKASSIYFFFICQLIRKRGPLPQDGQPHNHARNARGIVVFIVHGNCSF